MRLLFIPLAFMLIVYFTVELGWGGGNPNHKDHHRPTSEGP